MSSSERVGCVKLNKYQSVWSIVNAVCSSSDLEELKMYCSGDEGKDDDTRAHLIACKKALDVYEKGYFKQWSTPFLQEKVEECRRDPSSRITVIYEDEIRRRGHDRY